MVAMKRPAAAAAAAAASAPQKRVRRGVDPDVKALCGDVSRSIRENKLLSAGVGWSLCEFQESRHDYQVQMVTWIQAALAKKEADLQGVVRSAEANAREALVQGERLQTVVSEAAAEATRLSGVVGLKEAARDEAATAARSSEKAQAEAERAQRKAGAEVGKDEALRGEVAGLLAKFQDVTAGATLAKAEANALRKQLKRLRLDDSLVQSLPGVCIKNKDERVEFDQMALTQVTDALQERHAEAAARIADADPAKAEATLASNSARANAEAAQKTEEVAQAAVDDVAAAATAAEKAARDAKRESRDTQRRQKEKHQAQKDAEKALKEFLEGPLAKFQQLSSRAPLLEPASPAEAKAEAEAERTVAADTYEDAAAASLATRSP